jgi:hypothetical protein
MTTDLLLQISIITTVINNIFGITIGIFIVAKYSIIIEKRLKTLEKKVGITNNLKIQKTGDGK